MAKIRKNDEVIVTVGKHKNRTGKVIAVMGNRLLVEGVTTKKHQKPNPKINSQGGIVDKDVPIHISNVALVNPATKKADRVGYKIVKDGKKVRCFKSNKEVVE
jgi:large subunit ribosomal protein L24